MASWRDVERIVHHLPGTETGTGEIRSYAVNGKTYAWERPLRKQDLVALGDAAPQGAILCVRTPHVGAKEALLAAGVPGCFTTPHFNGYPAILIHLTRARVGDLREVLTEGWLCRVPKKVAKSYLDSRPGRAPDQAPGA